ncbi:MAG TPA: hypothetical protein VNX02_04505 [Steroidobacteraceae bacterium]|jgi:hypothetical protein|nr:hypothetical protein [Steroidobacteraceae bacterium]
MSAAVTDSPLIASRRPGPRGTRARRSPWEHLAPWVAPLLTAGLLAACTYLMFSSHGALLI